MKLQYVEIEVRITIQQLMEILINIYIYIRNSSLLTLRGVAQLVKSSVSSL